MSWLEHQVPPPIVMVIVAALMWLGHLGLGDDAARGLLLVIGIIFCVGGVVIAITGLRTLLAARTTPSPTQIGNAKHLVVSGIYTRTRNPMYLGMVIFLIGVECIFTNAWLLLGPVVFALYIYRFQIAPEERVMLEKFGSAYEAYRQRVRRWI